MIWIIMVSHSLHKNLCLQTNHFYLRLCWVLKGTNENLNLLTGTRAKYLWATLCLWKFIISWIASNFPFNEMHPHDRRWRQINSLLCSDATIPPGFLSQCAITASIIKSSQHLQWGCIKSYAPLQVFLIFRFQLSPMTLYCSLLPLFWRVWIIGLVVWSIDRGLLSMCGIQNWLQTNRM